MDPQQLLYDILEALWEHKNLDKESRPTRYDLCVGLEDLIEWIKKDGFMPEVNRVGRPAGDYKYSVSL